MKVNMKKILMSLIATILIITSVPVLALAVGDKNNSGSGSNGGSSDSSFTWTTAQSGYRFQIIDENFKPVGTTVDLVFTLPNQVTNQDDYYTNSRATALSSDKSKYARISIDDLYSSEAFSGGNYPPVPIKFTGNVAVAQGQAFKKWFLSGDGSMILPTLAVTSGGSSSGSGSGSSKPKPNNNHNSYSPSSTTKPNTKNDPKPSNDMTYVSKFSLINSASYRESKHSESLMIVIDQGYYGEAQKIINSQVYAINHLVAFRALKEDTSINDIQADEMSSCWDYYNSISNSYAETVFIYTSVIRNAFGSDWQPTGDMQLSQQTEQFNVTNIGADTGTDIGTKLENIPLASADSGYAVKLLNSKKNNKFLFDLTGSDVNDESKSVVNVMIEKGYSIIVEDLFWMIPAQGNSSGLPTSPIYSGYVYGTVGNHVEFAKKHGYVYGANGGAYGVILGSLGWKSMFLGEDWVGNGITIKGFSDITGIKSLSELSSMMSNNKGIAMHIYTTTGSSSQTTRDFSKGDIAHPAPDPSSLAGDDKKYKIVKYYEQDMADGSIDRNKFVTVTNPPKITINDEIKYRLKDWFITTSDNDGNADYASSKSSLANTRTGTKSESVELKNGELTVHLLLTKGADAPVGAGPLALSESEISKSFTTMDNNIPNWGPRSFSFSYPSMNDHDWHPVGLSSVPCNAVFGDSAYNYVISDSAAIDKQLEANAAGGVFASKMVNNTKGGTADINGGTNTLDKAEYTSVIWRGLDVPTIASYKESSSIDLKALLGRYDKKPVGDRGVNGSYQRDLLVQLNVDSSSDLSTSTNHSYGGSLWHTSPHTAAAVSSHSGQVDVSVYRGTNGKSVGNETKASEIPTNTPFGGSTSIHSSGFMVQSVTPIYFYPYLRMSYQTVGSNVKKDVNVLSQFYSTLLPNDMAEASWFNANESESLAISSTQWSLHAKATSAGKSWNGRNRVLPGGSIYQLGTGSSPTKVGLVTWQTLVTGNERASLSVVLPANEYTLAKATSEHNAYVSEAKTVLEGLNVVQWVNSNTDASKAWDNNGMSVKITEGNQSLSSLGLGSTTSTEAKYRLQNDGTSDAANEADLDVISSTDSTDVYFKVIASPDGSIFIAKSIGDINALSAITGTNPNNSGSATVTKILNKNVTSDTVDSCLTDDDAKQLNQRTLLITNFVKALERNKGMDLSASWATDGHWFNESFDGIIVCRKATILEVGFLKSATRTAVLDPRLCPKNLGQSDMFSKAFLSQFRVNDKSNAALTKQAGYLSSFQGRDISLKDMPLMYQSKRIFIPNVNVQDLN